MAFYRFARFLVMIVLRIVFRIRTKGMENIPTTGKVVICGNHASMLDPVFLGITIKRQINFMTKKEMFENKILAFILKNLGAFPVDREGADLKAVKNSLRVLNNGKILGIFPEGTRVKDVNIENAKPGIGMICIKGQAPVVPIYIDSTYKLFSKVNIIVGEPLNFPDLYAKKLSVDDYQAISKEILEKIYELKA